jgi:ABC-type amino acid transport substrate-binding protein
MTMKPAVAQQPPAQPRAMSTDVVLKPRTGDFDTMLERRSVRVLAPYSRTFFFNDMGRERGYAADLVRVVEKYLNTTLAKQLGKRPLTFLIIPTTRDRLLSGVAEGIGDIAVNVGVSESRKLLVDFILAPDAPPLAEVVLTGPASPVIASVDDLAGKTVHTRSSSVYHEDLVALNERFKKENKAPVNIVSVPDALKTRIRWMLNRVFPGHRRRPVANMWAAKREGEGPQRRGACRAGWCGWAIRKNSPASQDCHGRTSTRSRRC